MRNPGVPALTLEPFHLIGLLMRLQDDLSYMIECVSVDFAGEAGRHMVRTACFVEQTPFPAYIKEPVT